MSVRKWGVFIAVLAIAGCDVEWGLPDDESGDDGSTSSEIEDRLQGTWSAECLMRDTLDGQTDLWLKQTYVFSSNLVTVTERTYPDSVCIDADRVVEYIGDFDVDDEIIAGDGQSVWEIQFDFNDVNLIEGDGDDPDLLERYDILSLRDDDSGFFLGKPDENHSGDSEDERLDEVDFSVEYERQ